MKYKYFLEKNNHLLIFLLVYLLLIDAMASGIMLPITLKLAANLDKNSIELMRSGLDIMPGTGFIILFSSGYFLAAPILGLASDHWGRKQFLALCYFCSCLSYSLIYIGTSINLDSASIFIILSGILLFSIGGSSLPLLQTIVADISSNYKRAIYISWLFAALVVMEITGQFFNESLINTSHYKILLILALFELINFCLILYLLPETKKVLAPTTIGLQEIFSAIGRLFANKEVRILLLLLLFFEFTWGLYFEDISYYVNQHLHLTEARTLQLGYLNNVTMLLAFIGLYPWLIRSNDSSKLMLVSLGIFVLSFFAMLINSSLAFYAVVIPLCASAAIIQSTLWLMLINATGETMYGFALGLVGPAWAFIWFISGNTAHLLNKYHIKLPLILAALLSLLYFIIYLSLYKISFRKQIPIAQ